MNYSFLLLGRMGGKNREKEGGKGGIDPPNTHTQTHTLTKLYKWFS